MATVQFDNVWKRYPDGTEAVKGLSLDIADGEFIILVGPSGCGKSTAVRMVAGLEDISAGKLLIGGDVVNHLTPRGVPTYYVTHDRDEAMTLGDPVAVLKRGELMQVDAPQQLYDNPDNLS